MHPVAYVSDSGLSLVIFAVQTRQATEQNIVLQDSSVRCQGLETDEHGIID